jgi:hypothetical protein
MYRSNCLDFVHNNRLFSIAGYRHPVSQVQYRTGSGTGIFVHFGIGLTRCRTEAFRHLKKLYYDEKGYIHPARHARRHYKRWKGIHPDVHTAGGGKGYSLHVHTACGGTRKGYSLHVYTAGGGKGYSLHVHTAGGGKGYTLHVHTVGGGKGYSLHVNTAGGERDTSCTSIDGSCLCYSGYMMMKFISKSTNAGKKL